MKSSSTGSLAVSMAVAAAAAGIFLWMHQKPQPPSPAAVPPVVSPAAATAPAPAGTQFSPPPPAPDWWNRQDYPISVEVLADGRVRWRGKLFDLSQFIAGVTELVKTRPPALPAPQPGAPRGSALNRAIEVLTMNFGGRTVDNPSDKFAADTVIRALTPILVEETGLPVSQSGTTRILSIRLGGAQGVRGSITVSTSSPAAPAFSGSGASDMAEALDASEKQDWITAYNKAVQAMTKEVVLNGAPRNELPWMLAFQATSSLRDLPRLRIVLSGLEPALKNSNDVNAIALTRLNLEQQLVDDSKRAQRPATAASNPRFIFGSTSPTEDGRSIIGTGRSEIAWFADAGGGRLGARVYDSSQVTRPPVPIAATPPSLPDHLAKGATPKLSVEFIVGETGAVLAAWPAEPADAELERAAVRAVSKWTFEPAMKDGSPVIVRMVMPMTFWEK